MKEYIYFTTLSKEELITNITNQIKIFNKDYKELLFQVKSENEIWIGLEKGDHAGHWFIGKIDETEKGCYIKGQIIYDPDSDKDEEFSLFEKVISNILIVICYILLAIPWLIGTLLSLIKKEKTKEQYLDIFMMDYVGCIKTVGDIKLLSKEEVIFDMKNRGLDIYTKVDNILKIYFNDDFTKRIYFYNDNGNIQVMHEKLIIDYARRTIEIDNSTNVNYLYDVDCFVYWTTNFVQTSYYADIDIAIRENQIELKDFHEVNIKDLFENK